MKFRTPFIARTSLIKFATGCLIDTVANESEREPWNMYAIPLVLG